MDTSNSQIPDFLRSVQERAREDYFVDPERDYQAGSKITGALTTTVPIIASGGLAPLTAAGMMGESFKQEAQEFGATPEQQSIAFMTGAGTGVLSEALLGLPALLRSAKASGAADDALQSMASRVIRQAVLNTGREVPQEVLEQFSQNFTAKSLAGYDPARELSEGLGEAAALASIAGPAVGATFQAAAIADARRATGHALDTIDRTLQTRAEDIQNERVIVHPDTGVIETPAGNVVETPEGLRPETQTDLKAAEALGATEQPDASQIVQATTPDGDVREPEVAPQSPQEVPADVSSQGVQPTAPKITIASPSATDYPNKQKPEPRAEIPHVISSAINDDGIIYIGATPTEFHAVVAEQNQITEPDQDSPKRGFLVWDGKETKFVSRKEAAVIAREAKQLKDPNYKTLDSQSWNPLPEPTAPVQPAQTTPEPPPPPPKPPVSLNVPRHLKQDPELTRVLSPQAEPVPAKLALAERPEGGAAGGAGGKRKAVPVVGATPRGDRNFLRIPSVFKRLFQGFEREDAADVLKRQKNEVGQLLSRMISKHVDTEQEIYGQTMATLGRALSGMSRKAQDAAFNEVEVYLRAKENKRPLPALSSNAKKLVDAWFEIGRDTGNIARAAGVQVFDQAAGVYRPMGTVKEYVPRMFRRDVERVLSDPKRDPDLFNDLAQAIATHRGITLEDAATELRRVASRFQSNDFMANLEMARSDPLPEVFYEYDLRQLAARYVPRFSERMAQILAYGQRLGPREQPSRPNLWDVARKEAEDASTQSWLDSAEDQATNAHKRNPLLTTTRQAQTAANALLLSDPTGTVIRNLAQGLLSSAEVFGARRSLSALRDAARTQGRADAREIGAVRDNIADYLHSDQLGESFIDDAVRAATDAALKYSGYQGSEVFVRSHNGMVASQYIKDAAAAITKNPSSRLAKEALAMLQRWGVDAKQVVSEGGDWKTGAESRKFIRTAVREMQGGYRFDQVPLWANSTAGRFFYQYGRWGVQRARNLYNNVVKPAIGETVEWNGKKMVVRNVRPLLRVSLAAVGLGELYAAIASALFDRDRKDASFSEIKQAFSEDQKMGVGLALERALNDLIMTGTLGIWGQPVDFMKTLKDQSRLKNPAEPPSLAGVTAVKDLAMKAMDQNGQVTANDLIDFARQVARGPSNVVDVARNVFDEPLYEARNDVKTLRAAARRWGERAGLDVARRRGEFGKSKNAPIYEPIYEALLTGDADTAKQLAHKFLSEQKQSDRPAANRALRSSVLSRQPFRAGPYFSEDHREAFFKWAQKNLSKDDLNQVKRIQARYETSARKAGLMK